MDRKWQLVVIICAAVLAYVNIFGNGFVIDDQYFIKEWQLTRSWGNVGQLLMGANPESQPGVYRPVRSLLYLVYYKLFGTNPFFYHLHSLVVHLTATVLVYFIVFRLSSRPLSRDPSEGKDWIPTFAGMTRRGAGMTAFIAALLFGLHPIHTESITYIAASMEMTGVVFMLASFLLFIGNWKLDIGYCRSASLLLALLAFFTYEMTVTLPLLLVLYEVVLGTYGRPAVAKVMAGESGRWGEIREIARKTWAYWVGAAGFFAVRFGLGVGLGRGEYLAYSFYHTQLTMVKMWVKYLGLLVWPVTLSHNHTVVSGFEAFMTPYSDMAAILRQSILDPEILFSIGLIGLICLIGLKLRKKYPLVSFSIGWFFISLLPVAYFFPQGTAFAEKYLYIASVGWVMMAAYAIRRWGERKRGRWGRPAVAKAMAGASGRWGIIGVIVVIALLYGVRTMARNADWSSPRTLWEYEARIHPVSELAYYNLGIIYAGAGEKEKAVAAYAKALELKPQFWQAEHNLKRINTNPTNLTNPTNNE